jgi:hypothetical protein
MFKAGNLVIYSETVGAINDSLRLRPRNGSIGIILKPTEGYGTRGNVRAFDVNWISGSCKLEQERKLSSRGHYAVWTKNIQLAEVPYDPTQAGDTDDDI